MSATRRSLSIVLVAGLALGCSATSTAPVATVASSAAPRATVALGTVGPTGPSEASGPPGPGEPSPFPASSRLTGPDVAGAFDLATDGSLVTWSSGTVDVDAPSLWSFDPRSGQRRLIYRSRTAGAILTNLAVRDGTYAFAEVTPRPDGTRTWRLLVLDTTGAARVIDANDVPPSQTGVLPMAAISERGVLWASTHAGDGDSPSCELRYASLGDLHSRIVSREPCSTRELWYPRSDGRTFVYGTVEYPATGDPDERHVYLVEDGRFDRPRRLDADGQASLPAILGQTATWKAAPRDLNMFSPNAIVELPLSDGSVPRMLPLPANLTSPTIGPGFLTAEDLAGGSVLAWDRRRQVTIEVDRLAQADPGFLSGTRLSGDLLVWFYTTTTAGGGSREIRWLRLG